MKIKILNSISGLNFSYMGNEEVDVDAVCGNELVRAGHAINLEIHSETIEEPAAAVVEPAWAKAKPKTKAK